jgi:hypothetical protein
LDFNFFVCDARDQAPVLRKLSQTPSTELQLQLSNVFFVNF